MIAAVLADAPTTCSIKSELSHHLPFFTYSPISELHGFEQLIEQLSKPRRDAASTFVTSAT